MRRAILGAVAGALVGGFIGYKLAERKTKVILSEVDNEIESVKTSMKEYYEEKYNPVQEDVVEQKEPVGGNRVIRDASRPNIKNTPVSNEKVVSGTNYNKQYAPTDVQSVDVNSVRVVKSHIEVVSAEEADESDYNIRYLSLYSDGVLVDDEDLNVNVVKLFGSQAKYKEIVETRGLYGDDSTIFVLDTKKEIQYEIIFDERNSTHRQFNPGDEDQSNNENYQ